ncbi:MAG: hypothetical protein ABIJ65_13155 [Chloroflexota bacterium]
MENYEKKLLEIVPLPTERVSGVIQSSELMEYVSIQNAEEMENAIRSLVQKLPFGISFWPSFDSYIDDWYKVEVTPFRYNIFYCERGGYDLRFTCSNFFDAAFEVFKIMIPSYTRTSRLIAAKLDQIADQRLLIWLRMSSEIYHMHQINELFGRRMAVANIAWMSEELVRMGVADHPATAFRKKEHILKGLTLSGYPLEQANEIYNRIDAE